MTTSTNGGRIVEHVDGIVQSANDRGVKLAGEDGYRNFSKYADPPITAPSRGQHVRLGLDLAGFIRELVVLDGAAAAPSQAPSSRDREIRRLACLKAAATFCAGYAQVHEEVRSADVLKSAAAFERWVLQDGGDATV